MNEIASKNQLDALVVASQIQNLVELGQTLIKSGLLPQAIKTPEAAAVIIIKGRELGLPPMAALNGINVIQGKPTVSPQLMLALINSSGLLDDIQIKSGADGASCTMKRRGRGAHTESFGPTEAKSMGLSDKENYKKQAATMYKWRAVAACARVVFPDLLDGLYSPEELGADVRVSDEGDMEIVEAEATPVPAFDPLSIQGVKRGSEIREPGVSPNQVKLLAIALKAAGFEGSSEEEKSHARAFLAFAAGLEVLDSIKDLTKAQAAMILALMGEEDETGEYQPNDQKIDMLVSSWTIEQQEAHNV